MKIPMKYMAIITVCLVLPVVASAQDDSGSLYNYYTTVDRATLQAETREMGKSLQETFNQSAIESRQETIAFADYMANFRKLFLYAGKLAGYSEYERDLEFAKDRQLFQGLPETNEDGDPWAAEDRQAFASEKYERMKKNVEDEIGTYRDMLMMALDACEHHTGYGASTITADGGHRREMRQYMRSDAFRLYQDAQDKISLAWPDLAKRLDAQVRLWSPGKPGAEDPIIDPAILEAMAS